MSIDVLLDGISGEEVVIPDGWTQGRAVFGGLVAALMFRELQSAIADRPVRSVSVSFIAPVTTGSVTLQTEIFRQGRYVTQAECRLVQDGQVMAVMLGSFGQDRASAVQVAPGIVPLMQDPETGLMMPRLPGVTPEFVQHFDYSWTSPHLPLSGADKGEIHGWVRFSAPVNSHDHAHLLALIDAWPPSVLPLLTTVARSSSLTWSVEFVGPAEAAGGQPWWGYQATTDVAKDGYASSHASFFNASGELLAISRQVMAVFT